MGGGFDFQVDFNPNVTQTDGAVDMDPGGTNDFFTSNDDTVWSIDLSSASSLTITGDLAAGTSSSNASDTFNPLAGDFSFDDPTNSGEWTYMVDRADLVANNITSTTFTVTGDWTSNNGNPSSGTDTDTVTFNFTLCVAEGTRIATPYCERRVEDLKPGDPILTADGREVAVKWVGHLAIHPMFNPADRLEPVLVRQGALGDGLPVRDLVLSADHALLLEGYLVNAGALVGANGIEWLDWKALGASLIYYHIETEDHDAILAEGAPVETYIDYVSRQSFENYHEYEALYGTETRMTEMPLPRISSRRLLPDSLRHRFGVAEGMDRLAG